MKTSVLSVITGCFLACAAGCASSAGSRLNARAQNEIRSQVLSGSQTIDRFGEEVDILVEVTAIGPAFGLVQSSVLTLSGSSHPSDSTTWFNFNAHGWPESYEVEAEYWPVGSSSGQVVVTVEVSDFGHREAGMTVYHATHDIRWSGAPIQPWEDLPEPP